ncbi:MAG: 2-oxoglutarate dehydrogenase E1 component [Gammaproteobacteria bacterium]|nr:2-oxoglutarate dehydrogenase E1 component [Gammaproteobacteria bacterium]
MSNTLEKKYQTTPLSGGNAPLVEGLFEQFLADRSSVPGHWAEWFDQFDGNGQVPRRPIEKELAQKAMSVRVSRLAQPVSISETHQGLVSRLIQVYAARGHLIADIDPLGLLERPTPQVLNLEYFGLGEADLVRVFQPEGLASASGPMTLRNIIDLLQKVYCGKIGVEFAHVSRSTERLWLQREYELAVVGQKLTPAEKRDALYQLTAAEGMERYLHTRFVGQKRFSLEGGESMILLLEDLIQQGGTTGVKELVVGMAHRGRINVLVNILGKAPSELFSEFEGDYDLTQLKGSGDVKYHKGFSSNMHTPGGDVHIVLAFNPSHLEIVNPVVVGSVRARQHRRGDGDHERVVPVLIHGDAAFAGQGVVMETLQMSQARGFAVGGTIHIVCNNQIGFTTSDPADVRSTLYCSDVAKMIEAPVFHVNADDPEAVILATRLALRYRQEFGKDVVIDLVCYRRLGHNEADEPAVTQPQMYAAIRKHPTTRQLYADKLIRESVLTQAESDQMIEQYRQDLEEGHPLPRKLLGTGGNEFTVDWTRYQNGTTSPKAKTAVSKRKLRKYSARLLDLPANVTVHPRVQRILESREKMAAGEIPIDWGFAETIAYASLLEEGYEVRLTGQDSARGTFFHRHAVLHNQSDQEIYVPLENLSAGQGRFTITDSLLSEEAVMGFEYGFATTEPNALVIWEGQFGDFANGAQVLIDQFISSGEAKWGRLCGLTLFLPHGYEGQGPEHSSARLERFLQLCAEHNMQVCVPSNPAQMFHMLRRQMINPQRVPLIVMTPKSLLRHKLSVSTIEDLSRGSFQKVIDDSNSISRDTVDRVVFCSGKIYFDLIGARDENHLENVAIVRIEQLYPFPVEEYQAAVAGWPKAREIIWCQEEPKNQGAWYQIRHRMQKPLDRSVHMLSYAGPDAAAAPASGIFALHVKQQRALIADALALDDNQSTGKSAKRAGRNPTTARKKHD